jgi:gliding motility-associated-like protein
MSKKIIHLNVLFKHLPGKFLSMNRKILLLIFILLLSNVVKGQLNVTTNLTGQQLVNGLVGSGVTVLNISYTGSPIMAGSFTANGTNLGINQGVVLATGNADNAVGPNLFDNTGDDMFLPGNQILDSLSGQVTNDACILEFDFIPQSSQVSFRYVFGSEEYPEYVCSDFNDVFAFYISGPGISGLMNMALIPGSPTPVSINSVNSGVSGLYATAGAPCDLSHSSMYVDNLNGTDLELDGFTVPMTAEAIIVPCQMYHMRIMVADATDGRYDSWVFLEGGSFFSTPVVDAGLDQSICSGGTISLGAPAVPGYTYFWTPSAGLSDAHIANPTVTLIDTGSVPIVYRYVVIGNNGSCLFNDTVVITVNPQPTTTITVSPATTCIGDTIEVNYGGPPSTGYNWNFNSANIISGSGAGPYFITYSTPGNNSVSLTTMGACSISNTENVMILDAPDADFTLNLNACVGDAVDIYFNGTSSATANYFWNFSGGQINSGNGNGPYSITWNSPGTFPISLQVNDYGCNSLPANRTIDIQAPPPVFAGTNSTVCSGTPVQLGELPSPNSNYTWSPLTGLNDPLIANPVSTINNTDTTNLLVNYTVTASNSIGCSSSASVTVEITPGINVDFNSTGLYCINENAVDFILTGIVPSGATLNWNFGSDANPSSSANPNELQVHFANTGLHTISLQAISGSCPPQDIVHNIEIFELPLADFSANLRESCAPLSTTLTDIVPDGGQNYSWTISNGITLSGANADLILEDSGHYDVTLSVTSEQGCQTSITQDRYLQVFPMPKPGFATNPTVTTIENPVFYFVNNTINADIYAWDFGDGNQSNEFNVSHMYEKAGTYPVILVASNSYGCIDSTLGEVRVSEGFSFFVPNSFSPNGDGVNDFFKGYGTNLKSYELFIYDRWGKKIFQSNESGNGWDGKMDKVVQNDVYVYKINVVDEFDLPHEYVGSVTVAK